MGKKLKTRRPAILLRLDASTKASIIRVAAHRQTPVESYIRRIVLAQLEADVLKMRPGKNEPPSVRKNKR